jgi:hypothetical protein
MGAHAAESHTQLRGFLVQDSTNFSKMAFNLGCGVTDSAADFNAFLHELRPHVGRIAKAIHNWKDTIAKIQTSRVDDL